MHCLKHILRSYFILAYDFIKFNNDPNDLSIGQIILEWDARGGV